MLTRITFTQVTKTKTVQPTASATVTLFDLQIFNTSIGVDGYQIDNLGLQGGNAYVGGQGQASQFYIDPQTHYLHDPSADQYAVYQFSETGDFGAWLFVDAGSKLYSSWKHFTCKAECGKLLTCAIKGKDSPLFLFGGYDILAAGFVGFNGDGQSPVNLQVVGPTKGRS